MNILISYFQQIRYFKPYMIPVSTAMWDPKWLETNTLKQYVEVHTNTLRQ